MTLDGMKSKTTGVKKTTSADANAQSTEDEQVELLVGIPAYNEEIGIGSTILATQRYADHVVVVDDGSSDETVEIAKQAGATVLQHESNRGKGGAVKTILEFARATECDTLVLIDGDGQHKPSDIPQVTEPVTDGGADLVIGSRYLEKDPDDETPLYRRFGQRVLDMLTTGRNGANLTDTQSGFRAFSPDAIDSLRLQTDGIGVESEMIDSAVREDLTIEEASIDVRYEGIDGQTYNPLHHGLTVVTFMLQLIRDRHPLVFFGLPGLILTIAGGLYGLDAILIYQSTDIFYPAKVLVAGFTTIIGTLAIFCGLILNRISNMIDRVHEVGV
ncbi:Glycosyltransferase involved in cell wall bisynthesis [Haladaptatus litoreus]|uniref:Glycosyltransferase involved in cell wall bisynthesis n=1 Tax=Haladaptatus litoreus TaxID=553468 RepID=A0A1N7DLA6_9EURY|nr:glycosyltransferase family 2 protein [Haladaptatus litoreus]SIR76632.1 Glycosyltransferase involved in cell wall bisynthesis [Haladaptatus litoreus]